MKNVRDTRITPQRKLYMRHTVNSMVNRGKLKALSLTQKKELED